MNESIYSARLALAVGRLCWALKCNPELREALKRPVSVCNAMAELLEATDAVLSRLTPEQFAQAQGGDDA